MAFLQFPDGQIVNADVVLTFSTSSTNVQWSSITGTAGSYSAPNSATASAILNAIIANLSSNLQGVIVLQSLPCTLISCTPTTFAGHGSTIDIYGIGFYPGMGQGVINVEDSGGGFDSNGFTYSIQYLDSGHIQATWATDGDGTTGPSFIYYTAPSGVISSSSIQGITTT